MASGFIYLIILGMWAAYFLPKWMVSHDEASGKSAERYKSAMRVVGEAGSSTVIENDNFKIQNQIATRRIVFGALTFLIIAIGSLSAIGIISTTILLIPATALAIYVIHVRRQVVAAQLKARRIKAFEKNEKNLAKLPLTGGPFKSFLFELHKLQKNFPPSDCPIKIALVTARSAPTHERVIRTLRDWDIRIDECLFLGGLKKDNFLKVFDADIFFDDQIENCSSACTYVPTGHVISISS